jgi:hypothetical protein
MTANGGASFLVGDFCPKPNSLNLKSAWLRLAARLFTLAISD